jgi:hypothetical protein
VKRLLATAVCVSLLALVGGSPSLAADCSTPQMGKKGTLEVLPSRPAVGQDTKFLATIIDNRQVVEGSRRITIKGPAGTQTINPDTDPFIPAAAGTYTATYSQQVYSCFDPAAHTVVDTAGPRTFSVGGGEAATATFKALRSGRKPGTAALFGYVACPAASVATGDPLTLTVYYEIGGKRPSHSSPHLDTTDLTGCTGDGRARTRERQEKRFTARVEQGQMSIEVYGPATARVLLELSSNGRVLAATRAIFKASRKGETVKRDRASCIGAPRGCARWSIQRA